MNPNEIKQVIAEYEAEKQQKMESLCTHEFILHISQGFKGGQMGICRLCPKKRYFTWEADDR